MFLPSCCIRFVALTHCTCAAGCVLMHVAHGSPRDSKLTRILGEALGGVCKTSIIATLSPCLRSWDESVSTLRYASSAMAALNIEQLPKARRLEIQVLSDEGKPSCAGCCRWNSCIEQASSVAPTPGIRQVL
jgi:hypothetical protein